MSEQEVQQDRVGQDLEKGTSSLHPANLQEWMRVQYLKGDPGVVCEEYDGVNGSHHSFSLRGEKD